MPEENPQNPKPNGPSNVNITGVDSSIISDIAKAQSQAMDGFNQEIKKITKSLKVLEESIPKSIVSAMKDFTKEFSKTTAAEQQKATAALYNVDGHSSSASVATESDPSGDQQQQQQENPNLRSIYRAKESRKKALQNLKQFGPGGPEEKKFHRGEYTRFGVPEETTDYVRDQVSRFSETPATKGGKLVTSLEQVAGMSKAGPAEGFAEKIIGKKFGAKQDVEKDKSSKTKGLGIVQGPKGTSEGGTGSVIPGTDVRIDPDTGMIIPTLENQHYTSQQYAKTASKILNKSADFMSGRSKSGDLVARGLSASGSLLEDVGGKYLPAASLAANAVKSVYNPLHKFGESNVEMGVQQGVSARTGDLELPGFLGGLGFRSNSMLFNEAARKGAAMKLRDVKESRKSGLTRGQADEITGNIASMGYKYGTKREGAAFQTMSGLFRDNPQFENPQTYQLMDAMTKYRPTDSMKEFDGAMREMNSTVKNTNLSLGDMQKAAVQMVSFSRSMGGTATGGVNLSNAITSATGIQSDKYIPAMQSGFFQSNLALQTGLTPWEQGLAPTGNKLAALRKTFSDVKGMGPHTDQYVSDPVLKKWDPKTQRMVPKKIKISGADRDAALMGKVLGIGDGDPETVKTMEKALTQNAAIEDVRGTLRSQHTLGKGDWGQLSQHLKSGGVDKKMLTEIEKAGKSDKGIGGTVESKNKMDKKIQEYEEQISQKYMDRGSGKDQKGKDKKGKDNGTTASVGGVTITLDGNAAKLFTIKANEGKNDTNNGGTNGAQKQSDNPTNGAGAYFTQTLDKGE